MHRTERIIGTVCGLSSAVLLALIGVNAAGNPMDKRFAELEQGMAAVRYVPEQFMTKQVVNYAVVGRQVLSNESLWNELIAPPPPKLKVAARPNLEKMLRGVVASLRQEITGSDGRTLIRIKTAEDKRGSFKGPGDHVNGLTIQKITANSVVFILKKGGKEYTHTLPRR